MQQPSRTASMVAAYRARASEQIAPLCADPFARPLAGTAGFADAEAYDRGFPHMELYMGLRTALFDGETRRWTGRGLSQVVLLGAGLDTRAARLAREGVRFFEVDHPATQADKMARLAALPEYPVASATYVACDFAKDDFVDLLVASGFRADEPAFLIWEGVTYYLPEAAVRTTLRSVSTRLHPRSVLGFDHVGKRMASGEMRDPSGIAAREGVAQMGEPVLFGTDHALPMLHEEGFRKVMITTFDELALSLTGTYERARSFRFQYAVFASVAEQVLP